MEGLNVADANLAVYIHPSKAGKVSQAILRQLSTLLFKYIEVFDGVVLAYDVTFRDKNAKVLPGINSYFGVKLKAKMLLFSPKPDMLLEGKVVKLGKEALHVIVLGFSSACIAEEDIREEFHYRIKHGEEVFASTSHRRHVIKVGSMITFSVKSFDEEILHISGSLIPENTGSTKWLHKHVEEGSIVERSIKKQKQKDDRSKMQEHCTGILDNAGLSLNAEDQPKKTKSQRII
ncbi:PREDICTED: probable DNA-directed RNA polymerase I subunit RPA43 [Nelumbo nucifera]|uniref:DNA-directed RNA polymerase subunit n=3 Tax=Nelumbo nucifera TaxID=4432 RepID=A0A822ZBQ6_NELNU|nr:PREDICTED: probable DNA-directed RNA polymerase I subunit RPA43 [Nelumbo nucifera]DAD40466.1 TPA_asm: hypothetical protein HUJ06_014789 [Nelumbo nucifera]